MSLAVGPRDDFYTRDRATGLRYPDRLTLVNEYGDEVEVRHYRNRLYYWLGRSNLVRFVIPNTWSLHVEPSLNGFLAIAPRCWTEDTSKLFPVEVQP